MMGVTIGRRVRVAVAVFFAPTLAACAGATVNSGVGDTFLERAPWYAGPLSEVGSGPVVHLPVTWQGDPTDFEPASDDGSAVAALLADMNTFLSELGITAELETAPVRGVPPNVQFGCEVAGTDVCTDPADDGRDGNPRMRLAVARPSAAWAQWLGEELSAAGAEAALVITLEVGSYWPRQTNWRGSKEVELGSRHAVSLPWLTALDAPVAVLQLTGARVGPDGKARRIGAEGLLARRTNIVLAGFGVQALITEEDVAAIRSARREDLPGQPLTWQVALRNLVEALAGPPGSLLASPPQGR